MAVLITRVDCIWIPYLDIDVACNHLDFERPRFYELQGVQTDDRCEYIATEARFVYVFAWTVVLKTCILVALVRQAPGDQ